MPRQSFELYCVFDAVILYSPFKLRAAQSHSAQPNITAQQYHSPQANITEKSSSKDEDFSGDPYGTRTHVTAVKGRCLNHLTNGPGSGNLIRTDDIPGMNRVLYQLSYAAVLDAARATVGSEQHKNYSG